ncbi:uncharacterized protein DEA37_0005775 [Paragonimus westermani]|uniref:Uncharacterized protein n=1 Tax=Paragonimus westermani TaxID=34504 RepID=A0A5J4NAI7_9TREM|nr:uncharacterized protein DEA37_0005775 [Paragonimus westermani]
MPTFLRFKTIQSTGRVLIRWTANYSAQATSNNLPDGQIRYSTNKKWHASMNFLPKPRDVPVYQYPVIICSAFVCLVYFCFLREENDWDKLLAGEITAVDYNKSV